MNTFTVENELNYAAEAAMVTEIINYPNMNRLVGIPWRGFIPLVQRGSFEVGDTAVFFPPESQLSENVARVNNLYSNKELNVDTAQKGYLGKNRRVRAIKLRGVISSALVLEPELIGNPPVGTVFDTINGVEISRKYKQPVKEPTNCQTPRVKRINEAVFPEHVDTAQYLRNEDKIGPDDTLFITQKLHGCFPSGTKVTLWDGTTKRINQIKAGDELLGIDENGLPVKSFAVRDAFTTGQTNDWLRTTVSRAHKGDAPVMTCTLDHQVYRLDGSYTEAKDLRMGDTVVSVVKEPEITPTKKSVLIGLMLGDGSIAGKSIEWSHKADHVDYLTYVQRLLGNVAGDGALSCRTSGYGSEILGARTKSLAGIKNFSSSWAKNTVPEFTFDALSLAIWYMDDGSLAHSEKQQDRANFAICSFDDNSAEKIRQALVSYGFESPVVYKADGYNRLRLNKDDADKLFRDIADFVPEVMQYKLPAKYRGKFREPVVTDSETYLVVPVAVTKQREVSSGEYGYTSKWDLETTTHNFVANSVVVHNSSARFGRVSVEAEKTWKDRLAAFLRLRTDPRNDELYVAGSRHVVKTEDSQNFYGTDIWSKIAQKYEDVIPEGITIYGEIVGWASEDTPIQKDYTYRVPKGEQELYVYRVTVTTSSGDHYDLSDGAMREFCRARDMKVVPLLATYTGPLLDFDLESFMDRRFADEYLANNSCYNEEPVMLAEESPVDEGVVIRVEGVVPSFYKLKGPEFYAHQTAMLDDAVEDIEEEN